MRVYGGKGCATPVHKSQNPRKVNRQRKRSLKTKLENQGAQLPRKKCRKGKEWGEEIQRFDLRCKRPGVENQ